MTSIWEGVDYGGGVPADIDDTPRTGIDVAAGLTLQIGNLSSQLERDHKARADAIPRPLTIAGQGTCPTPTATFGFALGGSTFEGPSLGRRWFLRRIAVGGLQLSTSTAGTAEIYASGLTPSELANLRPLTEFVDKASTLPTAPPAFYANEQGLLIYGQRLCVVIVGGTAGQEYVASALVLDTPDIPQDYEL